MLADARIVYLFVYVTDLAASRRFYEDALGLTVIEADDESVQYDCGEVILALNEAPRYGIELTPERDNSTDVVWLVDDLYAVRDTLAARGVHFNVPVEYEVGVIVDFYDPDNHWLSLYQPSAEAMSWPSGARIAAVRTARERRNGGAPAATGGGSRNGATGRDLRGAELIYTFFFVPDAEATETFYRRDLGLRDIEGGPCSQNSNGDEEGVIKYDTGGLMLTTHFYDQTLPPLEPDEHGCPPRILDLEHMKGVAPAFAVPDVQAVVDVLRERRPGFAPQVTQNGLGVIATCEDPGGHLFFLWQPSDSALATGAGRKVRDILATPL
jgi:catechol 2,3-dioxygenase-like lactoylglutathione lyase family enzyme